MASFVDHRGNTHARPPQRHHPLAPNAPFLSKTFIASWRGQLLICTVVLVLGGLYLFVRRAISPILHRRREAISEARQAELMSKESEWDATTSASTSTGSASSGAAGRGGGGGGEKGKRKDGGGKKRKPVNTLKVSVTPADGAGGRDPSPPSGMVSATESSLAGPSSRETSPAAAGHLALPTPKSNKAGGGGGKSGSSKSRKRSVSPSSASASPSPSPRPQIRIRQPTAETVDKLPTIPSSGESSNTPTDKTTPAVDGVEQESREMDAGSRAELSCFSLHRHQQGAIAHGTENGPSGGTIDPAKIPLPPSPPLYEASSRRSLAASSAGGDVSDSTSASSSMPALDVSTQSKTKTKPKSRSDLPIGTSDGFSVMPDPSYLPPSLFAQTTYKKKKKRDRLPDLFDTNSILTLASSTTANSSSSQHNNQSSDNLSRYSQPTSVDTQAPNSPSSTSKAHPPPSPSPYIRGHARKASLKVTRPPHNATPEELEAYFNEKDQIIDSLRAEVGQAKAQEARARDAESSIRHSEDRVQKEYRRLRKHVADLQTEHNAVILELARAYEEMYNSLKHVHQHGSNLHNNAIAMGGQNAPTSPMPPMPPYHPSIGQVLEGASIHINNTFYDGTPHGHRPGHHPNQHPQHQQQQSPGYPRHPTTYEHDPHNAPDSDYDPYIRQAYGQYTPGVPLARGHPFIGAGMPIPAPSPMQLAPPSPMPQGPGSPMPMQMQNPMQMGEGQGHPHHGQHFTGHPMPGPMFQSPGPNMYPAMLHPNAQFHGQGHGQGHINGPMRQYPPAPFRRISEASSSADVFAGPLTPGVPSSVSSPSHAVAIGLGFPSNMTNDPARRDLSQQSVSSERRVSIAESVMRRKATVSNGDGASASASAPIAEVNEPNPGLGIDMGDSNGNGNGNGNGISAETRATPTLQPREPLSRTSSRSVSAPSCSPPSKQSSRESSMSDLHRAVVEEHQASIEAGGHGICDEAKVKELKASISDGFIRRKSPSIGSGSASGSVNGSVNGEGEGEGNGSDNELLTQPRRRTTSEDSIDSVDDNNDSSPELFVPYFPTMACSTEENEKNRQEYEEAQVQRRQRKRAAKANGRSFQNFVVEA